MIVAPVLRSFVPPLNSTFEPAATVKVPVLVPPPFISRLLPACTSTVPLLLKAPVLMRLPLVIWRGPVPLILAVPALVRSRESVFVLLPLIVSPP